MAKPVPKIVARKYAEAHAFARNVLKLRKGSYRVVTSPASLVGVAGEVHLVPGWDKRPDRYAMRNKLRFTKLTVIDHASDEAETPESESKGYSTWEETRARRRELYDVDEDRIAELRDEILAMQDDSSNGDNMLAEGAPLFEVPDSLLEDIREQLNITVEVTDDFTPVAEAVDEAVEEIDEAVEEIEPKGKPAEEENLDTSESGDEDNDVEGSDSDNDVEDERPLNGRRRRRCKECGELIHPDDVEDHQADHNADTVSLEKKAQERLK